jgi:protein TonB
METRRIRLPTSQSLGSERRLVLAVLLSLNFHAYLVYGLAPAQRAPGSAVRPALEAHIDVKLMLPDPVRTTPGVSRMVAQVAAEANGDPALPLAPELAPVSRDRPHLPWVVSRPDASVPTRDSHGPALPDPLVAPEPLALALRDSQRLPAPLPEAIARERSPDPAYHVAGELDRYPGLLDRVVPVHPRPGSGVDGVVTLQLYIDEAGQVTRAQVANAEPPGIFDDAAAEAFKQARFSPAQIGGETVRSQIFVKVRFDAER